jgi:predicted HicB family RNase H-like nuclease
MIEHKGYIAAVVYDDSVDMLHARVANSGNYPVATAEARDLDTLKCEFPISVNIYLDGCAELGIEPIAPTSVPAEAPTDG